MELVPSQLQDGRKIAVVLILPVWGIHTSVCADSPWHVKLM